MLQPKDKDRLSRRKNKTPIYAAYKRPTSNQGTQTNRKWKSGKRYFMQNKTKKKKAGVAIPISDKIDFEIKTMKRGKEGHSTMIKGLIQD